MTDYYTDYLEGSNILDSHSKNFAARLKSLKRRRDDLVYNCPISIPMSVPHPLLEAFTSMTEIDSADVRISCAATFPAVLLTIGSASWPLLKSSYEKLAVDADVRNFPAFYQYFLEKCVFNVSA